MKAVIQRVSEASVEINNQLVAEIDKGFLILLGIEIDDTLEDVFWLSTKFPNFVFFRIDGKMNNSIIEVDGNVCCSKSVYPSRKNKKRKQTLLYKKLQKLF